MKPGEGQNGPVDAFLDAVTRGGFATCEAWAGDVELDATVPNWRFVVRGAESVRDEYARWFASPGRFDGLRRMAYDGGEVVEYTLSWEDDGVPHASHHVHIFEIANARITRDTVMCGGRWSASLLAEMAEATHV